MTIFLKIGEMKVISDLDPPTTGDFLFLFWKPSSLKAIGATGAKGTFPLDMARSRSQELKFIHITKTGGTAIEDWAKAHGALAEKFLSFFCRCGG